MDLFNPLEGAQFALQSAAYTGTAGSTTGWAAGPQGTGATWRVSAIQLSSGGTVYAKPCNIS